MAVTYNYCTLVLDTEIGLPNTYKMTELSYLDDPYNHLPAGSTLLAWADDTQFSIEQTPQCNFRSVENIVLDSTGIPISMIGDFRNGWMSK